jgi:signal peptidase I
VLVDKLVYGVRIPFTRWELARGQSPRRGEVVIFDRPADGLRMIKRVAAVGGDTVSLVDGELRVNGESSRVPGLQTVEVLNGHQALLNLSSGGGRDIRDSVIPAGQLLVIGDNRGNSQDGRFFGLIPEDALYGHARGVIYRSGEGLVWRPL